MTKRSDVRRNGGGSRIDPQPAAVPVLLTLLFLSEWIGGSDGALFDTSHELSGDGINCEIDLVAITYGARPEQHTHILIGECKGRGYVTEKDVTNLSAVAQRLRDSGSVECDVVFSTTRDAFTEEELALFRKYHESSSEWDALRRAPILLTANELDFHRHAQRSRLSKEANHLQAGFTGLVTWSTQQLADPSATAGRALDQVASSQNPS